jgi:hypothetical protein
LSRELVCLLCGIQDADVRPGLAWFEPALASGAVQSIHRCRDVDACRARLEATGETWPLISRDIRVPAHVRLR